MDAVGVALGGKETFAAHAFMFFNFSKADLISRSFLDWNYYFDKGQFFKVGLSRCRCAANLIIHFWTLG
jgi:hypothetical protein